MRMFAERDVAVTVVGDIEVADGLQPIAASLRALPLQACDVLLDRGGTIRWGSSPPGVAVGDRPDADRLLPRDELHDARVLDCAELAVGQIAVSPTLAGRREMCGPTQAAHVIGAVWMRGMAATCVTCEQRTTRVPTARHQSAAKHFMTIL
jgi:hypothetical protein